MATLRPCHAVLRVILLPLLFAALPDLLAHPLRPDHPVSPRRELSGGSRSSGTPKPPKCNVFDGEWVRDDANRPAYTMDNCPYLNTLGGSTNCLKDSARSQDWMKYSWQPKNCGGVLRFSAPHFLGIFRNKVLGFVGDSLMATNFFPALLCTLSGQGYSLKQLDVPSWMGAKGGIWNEPTYNVTFVSVWSPFLAWYTQDYLMLTELGDREPGRNDAIVKPRVLDGRWSSDLGMYDVLVMQSSFHWVKTGSRRGIQQYFVNGKGHLLQPQPSNTEAFAMAVQQVKKLIRRRADLGLKVPVPYFLSPPPRLNGCQRATTLSTKGQVKGLRKFNSQSSFWLPMQQRLLTNSSVRYVDITHLSLYRPDAFMSSGSRGRTNDCLHSCLPGLPDTWVEILYSVLVNDPALNKAVRPKRKTSSGGGSGSGSGSKSQGQGTRKSGSRMRFAFKYPSMPKIKRQSH